MNHQKKKELLLAHQFGFRPGLSAADLSYQPEPSMAVLYQCRKRRSSAGSGYCRRFQQGIARRSATETAGIWKRWHPSPLAHKLPVQPQPTSPSMANPSREVWLCESTDCGRSKLVETPWSDLRQNVEFWPTSAFSCSACSLGNRLPAQSVCRSRHLLPAHHIQRLRTPTHGVQSSCVEWGGCLPSLTTWPDPATSTLLPWPRCHCRQPWTETHHQQSLSAEQADVWTSPLCSPCLLPPLPRRAHHTTHPRTRPQAQVSSGHNLQFSLILPPWSNNTILHSFPHALIPTWNSLPPSILHEQPHLRHLQRFKTATYAIYGRRTGFGPHKLMSNTFSACFSPHWWQLTFISCLLFYLFMRSSPPPPPPPSSLPLFSLVRWIRKDAETTGRLGIFNPVVILLPIHSSWYSFGYS